MRLLWMLHGGSEMLTQLSIQLATLRVAPTSVTMGEGPTRSLSTTIAEGPTTSFSTTMVEGLAPSTSAVP